MIEAQTDITTADGAMGTFLCHPERGGPYPVILLYMDAPGIREELRDMARRLATVGYYVALPNLYYRQGVEDVGPFIGEANIANRQRMMALRETLTIDGVMSDTEALLAFVAQDGAADTGTIGTVGYCMSGTFAINAARRFPAQVRAAASIYGVQLVTDQPDSPHLAFTSISAAIYIACAENDAYVPPEMIDALEAFARDATTPTEVERYPGTEHGFAFPQRPIYDKPAAERHWERLFALFGGALR